MIADLYSKLAGRCLVMLVCLIAVAGSGALQAASAASPAAEGDQVNAEIKSEEDLREYVAFHTSRMADRLDELRAHYEKDPQDFYRTMEEELTDFVDFRRIAARVMARYARQATPEQRDAFVEKFKRSLFETYSKALADTRDFSISVNSARFLSPEANRASVDLTISSDSGQNYGVAYSLYKNSEGRWLMENIVVEGVNIGLAFRDRFQQEMEKHRGNIQAVIDNWSGEVKALEEKARLSAGEKGDSEE